jgi:C4-type zinc ribbon domain
MDSTVCALTDLAAVDNQLSGRETLTDGLVLALEERRAALRGALPGLFLAAYDALCRAGRRPVIVPMRGAHCGGCYLSLPPQLASSIRRRQSPCTCPHCGRLLYSSLRVAESETASKSKQKLGNRPAGNGGASKRARRIPGMRPARHESHAAKRRVPPQGKDQRVTHARRASQSGGNLGAADSPPGKATPVER